MVWVTACAPPEGNCQFAPPLIEISYPLAPVTAFHAKVTLFTSVDKTLTTGVASIGRTVTVTGVLVALAQPAALTLSA